MKSMTTMTTMTTKNILLALALLVSAVAFSQVGIGTTNPDASSILDLDVSSLPVNEKKGFLPPRLSTSERNGIASPATGLTIYNTDVNCLQFHNGKAWYDACEGGLTPGALSDCNTSGFIPPFLTADETIIEEVTSATSKIWMDRNLGAYTSDRTPPSSAGGTDCWAYGNLYQWGRNNDGHEDRTSSLTTGPVEAGNEGSDFITVIGFPFDWLSTPDATRWGHPTDSGKGVHDPCPDGYRLPTEAELNEERSSWGVSDNDREGAINSPLKLPVAGYRSNNSGGLTFVGSIGRYWSSAVSFSNARILNFDSSLASMNNFFRVGGATVRCIKD